MASLYKAYSRDRKIKKRKYGMRIDNRNIHILEEIKRKKDLEIAQEREEKEKLLETSGG